MQRTQEVYLLDIRDTQAPEHIPTEPEIRHFFDGRGLDVGTIKIYNPTCIKIESADDVTGVWSLFEPVPPPPEAVLGEHVRSLIQAEAEVKQISPTRRTAQDRLLLALTALVKAGYGVTPD